MPDEAYAIISLSVWNKYNLFIIINYLYHYVFMDFTFILFIIRTDDC